MRRLVLVLAGTACLAVLAAGCGGDDDGSGEQLTKAEFVTQANAICREANEESGAIKPDLPPNFDPTSAGATDAQLDTFGDYVDDIVEIYRSEVDELRDLNPPDDVQDDWNKALSLVDESLNEVEEAADAAHDGDREQLKEKLQESDKHSNEANAIAKDLGVTVCAG